MSESPRSQRIAFVGLGVMGAPMAAHLLRAGHALRVFNRSHDKAVAWQQAHGGQACNTLAAAVTDAQVLITCVGNDDDLRQICLGEQGVYAQMPSGSLHIDHTTTSALLAHELAEAARAHAIGFVDAPVSGGQAGAENAQLSVMCGGSQGDYQRAQAVFAAYAASSGLIGPVGSGQLCKMVNQICVAGVIQGLAEGLRFGEQAGLDMHKVLPVIEHGAAGSWQMKHRGSSMLAREFDFGFAVDWMRKDLGIVDEQARASGASLPITRQIAGFYEELHRAGGGRWDTSALIKQLDAGEA